MNILILLISSLGGLYNSQPSNEIVFMTNGISYYDGKVFYNRKNTLSEKDMFCATSLIYHEAKSAYQKNPQALYNVFQVILNRAKKNNKSLCEISKEKGQWSNFKLSRYNKISKTKLWKDIKVSLNWYYERIDVYQYRFKKITRHDATRMYYFAAYRIGRLKYHGIQITSDRKFCPKKYINMAGHIYYASNQ